MTISYEFHDLVNDYKNAHLKLYSLHHQIGAS